MALYEGQIVPGAIVDHMHETINSRTGLQRTREVVRRGIIERVDEAPSGAKEVYVRFREDAKSEIVPPSELTMYRSAIPQVASKEEASPVFSERQSKEVKTRPPTLEDKMGLTKKLKEKPVKQE